MATENPTGDGRILTLSIPVGNAAFLRRVIGAAKDGIREELDCFGDQLRESRGKLLLEEEAYAALSDGLDLGRIVPDSELCAALIQLAKSIDHDNEYERVVFEHGALDGLLGQLEGRAV